jgi:MSHA biogenesis protein MshP
MKTNRIKAQGTRLKVQGSRFVPCGLHLAPCGSHPASRTFQRGFSLVTAIFLLVVIAALGTFTVTLFTTQQQSAALDVLGSRAYQAARAGIEWGAYQALRNGSCVATQPLAAMPNTLAGFTVTVTCNPYPPYNEAGATVNMYQLTSTANQGAANTPNFVERQMTVTIAQ